MHWLLTRAQYCLSPGFSPQEIRHLKSLLSLLYRNSMLGEGSHEIFRAIYYKTQLLIFKIFLLQMYSHASCESIFNTYLDHTY